jgi:hypothetical protein
MYAASKGRGLARDWPAGGEGGGRTIFDCQSPVA